MEYGLVVVWLLAYVALGALALPAAALLLRSFPDRGAGFALPVALTVLGVVGFWVGQVAFGWPALAAGLLALVGVAALSLWRGASPDPRRYAGVTVVFTVAFLFLVAVRALDPAVHPGGGEKFLDFGMLSALARTSQLPPEDFWFAGEPVQYYYGGHMLAALLARLTGTAPRYAYNLALAGFYATFVTAAYSLAGAVAHHRGRSRVSAGLFAAFLVGIASNLATPLRALAWWVGDGTVLRLAGLDPEWATTGPEAFSYWPASRVVPWTVNEFPLFAFLNGDLHAHMISPPLTLLVAAVGYAYWRTPAADLRRRRLLVVGAVPPTAGLVAVVNTWSFPATLGLVWLALALAPADPRDLLPVVGPTPTAADADEPVEAADGGRPAPVRRIAGRLGDEGLRTGCAVGLAGVVGGLAVVAAFPFLAGTGATGGRGLTFVAPADRSRVGRLLVVHGTTLALAAAFLGGRLRDGLRDARETSRPAAVAAVAAAGLVAVVALVTLVLPAIVGVDPRVLGATPFVALVAVGWVLLRAEADVGYETVLLVGAAGLVTLVEFVYVTRTGPGRFNTVFKVYSQVWALTAVAGGVLLAEYANPAGLPGLRDRRWLPAAATRTDGGSPPPETDPGSDDRPRPDGAAVDTGDDGRSPGPVSLGGVLVAGLVLSLSLYGALAGAEHVAVAADRGPATLDALRFAEERHSAEWPAIEYVRGLEGTPTVVTAPAEDIYRWSTDRWVRTAPAAGSHEIAGAAAPASLSGVPTLAGWVHETGYRGETAWFDRVETVNAVYGGTPSRQARLLAEHDVEYVYVGPAERQRYDESTLALDERLTGVGVVPESRDWEYVTLYRVDRSALGVTDAATESDEDDDGDGDGDGSGGRSDRQVTGALQDLDGLGVDPLDVEEVRDEVAPVERPAFVLGADDTPQLHAVRAVVVAVAGHLKTDELLAVVLDDPVRAHARVAVDDQPSHYPHPGEAAS